MNATDLPPVDVAHPHCPLGCPNHECEHDIGQHDDRRRGNEGAHPVCSALGCPCGAERGVAA